MSNCIIKNRKAEVKLFYNNIFDFSYNDSNECIFESARREIKTMLLQDLDFFLRKLKIKINGIEYPFLNNCEKCRGNEPLFKDKNKIKKPSTEFEEIFSLILDEKKNSKFFKLDEKGKNEKKENEIFHFSSKSKTEKNIFNLKNHTENNSTYLNLPSNKTKLFLNDQNFLENNKLINQNINITNNIPINKSNPNLINQNNSNLIFLKIPKENNNIINLSNSANKSLISNQTDNNINNSKQEDFEKNTKEELDSDISCILSSNNEEPNFLKCKQDIDGGSTLSYENLTVLDEAKSPQSSITKKSQKNSENFIHKNYSEKENKNKLKIGCFMEEETGKKIDLLICDNFKSKYESSIHPNILKNTSHCFSTKQINMLEKNKCVNTNHKIYILYGNIAYSMGAYDKALKFYQTGLITIKEESTFLFNFLIIKTLFQNNIAKCMLNLMNVKGSIGILEIAENNLSEKINILDEKIDKNYFYKILLLKVIIELNLSEAYYCVQDYKTSGCFLDKVFEDLTSENTLKYYESHKDFELAYDDKEISKFFVKYYYLSGKIQFRLENYQLALDYFNQSINLRKDLKNENKEDQAQVYNYLALIFCKQNQFEKALKNINKSYNIYWLLYGEEHYKTNLSSLNHSFIFKKKNENLKALEILNKSKDLCMCGKDSDEIFTAVFYRAIGTCYFEMENEIKGLNYYSKANNIYKKYYSLNNVSMSEINSIIINLFGLISI